MAPTLDVLVLFGFEERFKQCAKLRPMNRDVLHSVGAMFFAVVYIPRDFLSHTTFASNIKLIRLLFQNY